MLETVGAAIHAADPGARVVSSALSSGAFVTLPGCAGADFDTACRVDPDFLRGIVTTLKARGALGQLDVIAVNYFSSQGAIFGTPQLENWAQLGPDHVGRVAGLRQKMRDGGLTEAELKPIVVLEGSFTGELGQIDNPTTPEAAAAFSQAQRNYVVKALARAAAADVLAYYWFWLRDTVGGLGGDVPYGLVDTGGAPKPSYQAYRHFTGLIRRRDQFVRTLSFSSPKLEGYELTATDGRLVQVVWNQVDEEAIAYAPGGTILGAVGPIGEEVAPTAGAVAVGPDPRFIFYAP
jgi:hypothetical protein